MSNYDNKTDEIILDEQAILDDIQKEEEMAGLLMMNDDAINAHDANEAEKAKLNELITTIVKETRQKEKEMK